jgi:hypothetical protein
LKRRMRKVVSISGMIPYPLFYYTSLNRILVSPAGAE